MAIDVIYEGVVLHKGTKMMATPTGTFVELEHPMPVGTRLQLEEHGVAVPVRVERVQEGASPGVFVAPDLETPAAAPPPAPAAHVNDEMPPADTEQVASVEPVSSDEPTHRVASGAPTDTIPEDGRKTKRTNTNPPATAGKKKRK